jgi:Xaa-Pro aminopeptidase
MGQRIAALREVRIPDIGYPKEPRPQIPGAIFEARLARVRHAMEEARLDALVVYGDREHFATIQYLTNYDPRFEETLLVVLPAGKPTLFVGNEGMGYSPITRLEVDVKLYQTLSLLGQPRDKVRPLHLMLKEAGLGGCRRVGTAGWKYFSPQEVADAEEALDVPDYVARSVRLAAGKDSQVTNQTALFMDAENGLRNINEPDQLADFEWIATVNSQSLLDGIRALRPGMTEYEGFQAMKYNGMPLSCHAVVSSGEYYMRHGLPSPTGRTIQTGEAVFMSMSYQGANTCRFGWMARDANDLPASIRDYEQRVAAPYAAALGQWYETLRVGATGDELHRAAVGILSGHGLRLGLNAGHLIAMDEWTHSLVAEGSQQRVLSGMYWQADFFPMSGTPHYGAFAEDGVFVADAALRDELRRRFPILWNRIEQRRRFMIDQLGIYLCDDALPVSNVGGAVMPFFLSPARCMALRT